MASFSLDIQRFVNKANDRMDLVLQKVALELGRQVILASPVGNPDLWSPQSLPAPEGYIGGTFRGNWQTSIGVPDLNADEGADPSGREALAQLQSVTVGASFGQTIYITNNLPYAEPLEDGHSTQAPNGVVKITVANYPGVVARSVAGAKQERP